MCCPAPLLKGPDGPPVILADGKLRKQDSARSRASRPPRTSLRQESSSASPQQLRYFNHSVQSFSGIIRPEFLLHCDDSAFLYLHFRYFCPAELILSAVLPSASSSGCFFSAALFFTLTLLSAPFSVSHPPQQWARGVQPVTMTKFSVRPLIGHCPSNGRLLLG